jgi:hypothetical protein
MVFIPHTATDQEVLTIVRHWVDVLAKEDYAAFFSELGYAMLYRFDCPGDEAIRQQIKKYRSPDFYPGVTDFKVTDWRLAQGGNPNPKLKAIRYKPNDIKIAGAIQFDLPLNNQWSDLTADFVYFDNPNFRQGYVLGLEEIQSFAQWQRDVDEWDAKNEN